MPKAADPPLVEAGLGRIDLPFHQRARVERHVLRIFMTFEAHPMPGSVSDEIGYACSFENLSRSFVDPTDRISGDGGLTRGDCGVARGFKKHRLTSRWLPAKPGSLILNH